MCVYRLNQLICRRDSSCTRWQAVTGLIIRRLNLNPTCYIIHITHYRETEQRSHAHGKKKDQCSIIFGLWRRKVQDVSPKASHLNTGPKPGDVFLIGFFFCLHFSSSTSSCYGASLTECKGTSKERENKTNKQKTPSKLDRGRKDVSQNSH